MQPYNILYSFVNIQNIQILNVDIHFTPKLCTIGVSLFRVVCVMACVAQTSGPIF